MLSSKEPKDYLLIQPTNDHAIIPAINDKKSVSTRTGHVAKRDFHIPIDWLLLLFLTTTNAIPVFGTIGTRFVDLLVLQSASRLTIVGRNKSESAVSESL